jgi:hypothetical protein
MPKTEPAHDAKLLLGWMTDVESSWLPEVGECYAYTFTKEQREVIFKALRGDLYVQGEQSPVSGMELAMKLSPTIRDSIIEECARAVESQKLTEPAHFGGNKWGAAGAMQLVCAAAVRELKKKQSISNSGAT